MKLMGATYHRMMEASSGHDPLTALLRLAPDLGPLDDAWRDCGAERERGPLVQFLWDQQARGLTLDAPSGTVEALRAVARVGLDLNAPNARFGRTVLHRAIADRHPKWVRTLIDAGVDLEREAVHARTPLAASMHRGDPLWDNDPSRVALLQAGAKITWPGPSTAPRPPLLNEWLATALQRIHSTTNRDHPGSPCDLLRHCAVPSRLTDWHTHDPVMGASPYQALCGQADPQKRTGRPPKAPLGARADRHPGGPRLGPNHRTPLRLQAVALGPFVRPVARPRPFREANGQGVGFRLL